MNENSILLTNFPSSEIVNQEYIKKLVGEMDSKAVIKRIVLQEGMKGNNAQAATARTAYAIVEFELNRFVATVRRGMRKHWIGDKLVKVKTLKDVKKEHFNERTVVVTGLPKHFKQIDLLNVFNSMGAITSIEVPTIDHVVKSALEEKGLIKDHFMKVSQKKKEEEYRLSQQLLRDAEDFDKDFNSLLSETWGEETASKMTDYQKSNSSQFTKFDMLDEERVASFKRVMF